MGLRHRIPAPSAAEPDLRSATTRTQKIDRAIAARSTCDKDQMRWGDQTGMRSDHLLRRPWNAKGETPGSGIGPTRWIRRQLGALGTRQAVPRGAHRKGRRRTSSAVFVDGSGVGASRVAAIVDGHPSHKVKKEMSLVTRPEQPCTFVPFAVQSRGAMTTWSSTPSHSARVDASGRAPEGFITEAPRRRRRKQPSIVAGSGTRPYAPT